MKPPQPRHEEIAARAYRIFLERGGQHGYDRDDWLQAEYELMQLPVRKIAELPLPKELPAKSKFPSIINVVRTAVLSDGSPVEESRPRRN